MFSENFFEDAREHTQPSSDFRFFFPISTIPVWYLMENIQPSILYPPITPFRNDLLPPFLNSPDSGLGCSGPAHIEDWASLSILLPKHVAEACSFFKSNAQLLSPSSSHSNCIERKRTEPCRTCFRVRRRIHPPNWAHSTASRHVLCDCSPDRPETSSGSQTIRARELSVVGLPIYATKRSLVEAVVEAVAAIARGDAPTPLFAALAALVSDGLKDEISSWNMIRTVTAPGPATKDVYSIVNKLDSSEKSENSRVEQFFEELFRENSLDCWLCYVVLKENVLRRLYSPGGFLLDAPSAYRTLLWRLVDALALIPVLEFRECSQPHHTQSMLWSGPCRLPADSRVPKSSSVPARLSNSNTHRRSRIPLVRLCLAYVRTSSVASAQCPIGTIFGTASRFCRFLWFHSIARGRTTILSSFAHA
ncbi:unnamed protein product [Heligmosomoides polygyrus]|uniref:RUN domain-containing protein n=1 Tax=Heligmosomoides polygyrus TaxID=6339 RepID=A0A3P7ZV43_HELPZ|nr:unnamed protein product [Heligmosomoides polygyrus]